MVSTLLVSLKAVTDIWRTPKLARPGLPKPGRFHQTSARLVPDARLELDHLELRLRHAAVGTHPVTRDVGPARAGREAFLGQPLGLVVDKTAGAALKGLERLSHAHAPMPLGFP